MKKVVKKTVAKTGKRILNQMRHVGNVVSKSSPAHVLKQLANSQQIQHAVKDVVARNSDLPAAASAKLIRQVVQSRKRPAVDDDALTPSSSAKRTRLSPGYSRMSYRGKQIQRGGTKQQRGGQFLF
ncbi:MAG: hypothetical protein AAGJ80_05170 [Cyanobacteria bacterium J06553_1]